MNFTKLHGLGNDFVLIDSLGVRADRRALPISSDTAQALAHRQFGIGCDQVLVFLPPRSPGSILFLEIWNPDGSQAEMCGNGVRAVSHYLVGAGIQTPHVIETLGGIKTIQSGSQPGWYRVDMGVPEVRGERIGMGNPHWVNFVSTFDGVDLSQRGSAMEHSVPGRTNVEFVRIHSRSHIEVKVWERGAGATLACGTGACASVARARAEGLVDERVRVTLPGGDLEIEWPGPGQAIVMTGPAVEVATGKFLQ